MNTFHLLLSIQFTFLVCILLAADRMAASALAASAIALLFSSMVRAGLPTGQAINRFVFYAIPTAILLSLWHPDLHLDLLIFASASMIADLSRPQAARRSLLPWAIFPVAGAFFFTFRSTGSMIAAVHLSLSICAATALFTVYRSLVVEGPVEIHTTHSSARNFSGTNKRAKAAKKAA